MLERIKNSIRISIIFLICFLFITGCANTIENKYRLDKNNPVAAEIWHYYNGVQK